MTCQLVDSRSMVGEVGVEPTLFGSEPNFLPDRRLSNKLGCAGRPRTDISELNRFALCLLELPHNDFCFQIAKAPGFFSGGFEFLRVQKIL